MARHGSQQYRRMVIEPEELEAMEDALVSRPDCDRVEISMGLEDKNVMFYYGVFWKPYYDAEDDFDFDDEDED